MPKLNDLFPSKWLRFDDLSDDGDAFTIRDVAVEMVGEDSKPCLYFDETTKVLGCNKTNAKTIGGILGNDTDDWIGKKVVLFPTQCDYQGEQVDCIRVHKRKTEVANTRPAAAKKPAAKAQPARPQTPAMTQEEVDADDDIPFDPNGDVWPEGKE